MAVILSKATSLKLHRADTLIGLLVAFAFASQIWTLSAPASGETVKNFLGFGLIFVAIRATVTSRRMLQVIASGYLVGCVIAVWRLFHENPTAVFALVFTESAQRFTLEGVNANYLAYALVTGAALVVLMHSSTRRNFASRVLYLALLVACYVGGVVLPGTRAALAGFAGLILWAVVRKLRLPGTLGALYLGLILINLAIVAGRAEFLFPTSLTTVRETGDLNGRLTLWPLAREVFFDHPFIGQGAGTFPSVNLYGIAAHNAVLDLGTGLGIVGVCLFFGVLYAALIAETRDVETRRRGLLLGAVLVVSGPFLATGYWIESPAFWVAVALFSRMAYATRPEPGEAAAMARVAKPAERIVAQVR